jgi:N-acetylneuraminic acid mutarotase
MGTFRRVWVLASSLVLLIPVAPAAASASDSPGNGVWRRFATVGAGPSERSAPVAVGIGDAMYVFGGGRDDFSTGRATFYNDLHRLDVRTHTWTPLAPVGEAPAPRAFAAGAAQPSTRRMFVFGGSTFDVQGTQFQPFDDLWAYSAMTNRWTRLGQAGGGPSARSGSTMWAVGDLLYIFGGIDATFTTLNELWVYDLRRGSWTLLPATTPAPGPRHVAQAGAFDRIGRLTLYGGEDVDPNTGFVVRDDTWQFDLARRSWRNVTPVTANIDPPRNYGAAAIVGASLYLQGGDVPGGEGGCGAPFPQNPTDQLWRFDLVHLTWQQLHPGGDPAVRLKRHAAATVDGRMFVVSGWDFHCEGGTGPGQLWNLNVYSFSP